MRHALYDAVVDLAGGTLDAHFAGRTFRTFEQGRWAHVHLTASLGSASLHPARRAGAALLLMATFQFALLQTRLSAKPSRHSKHAWACSRRAAKREDFDGFSAAVPNGTADIWMLGIIPETIRAGHSWCALAPRYGDGCPRAYTSEETC